MKHERSLFHMMTALALACAFAGCGKDIPPVVPEEEATPSEYTVVIACKGDVQTRVLTGFSAPVAQIDNPASWLSVTPRKETEDGHPVIEVTSSRQADTEIEDVTVKLVSENGEVANVLVQQGVYLQGDAYSGANADFLTDWENCEEVRINGKPNPVATPWVSNSQSNIPYEVRKQVSKAEGWEMAFCSLNNTATDKICYFALYNKWSGTLRVFHYLIDPTGYGQEISYQVWMGRQKAVNDAPFYNSLEFGVPSRHEFGTSMTRNACFVDSKEPGAERHQTQSFMAWVTPYMEFTNNLLDSWYCFDLDLTGFLPGGTQWRDVNDDIKMMIVPLFRNVQTITLRGTLTGDIKGSFENPETIQKGGGNCMSGLCGVLDWISGTASGSISSSNQYASLLKNDQSSFTQKTAPYMFWGGFACNVASGLLGFIGKKMAEPVSYEHIPGKIDMKLDATLDLAGTISNYTSSGQSIFNVTLDDINSANGDNGHLGRGIWSLADDPVVYIDKDDLLADYDHFTLYDTGGGYQNSDFADYGVRLVWFFDPTSVKVNLNTDLFPDVGEVFLSTTCGVYPNRPAGYTADYRSFLMLENPFFSLNSQPGTRVVRLGPDSKPRIITADRNAILLNDNTEFETPGNSVLVRQKGGDHRYYGREIEIGQSDILYKTVIVDPQIYLACDGKDISLPQAPDLVVTVSLTFESQGSTFLYTKSFIPRIELIDRTTTLQKYAALTKYAETCANQVPQPAYVANAPSILAYHHDGDVLVAKSLRMLELVKGK